MPLTVVTTPPGITPRTDETNALDVLYENIQQSLKGSGAKDANPDSMDDHLNKFQKQRELLEKIRNTRLIQGRYRINGFNHFISLPHHDELSRVNSDVLNITLRSGQAVEVIITGPADFPLMTGTLSQAPGSNIQIHFEFIMTIENSRIQDAVNGVLKLLEAFGGGTIHFYTRNKQSR
ncbi:hypothetical protein NX722_07505 [Endozoicomonas gorgoniicola]|uniref:Uncharacterized protein n=1 Tax=Endozoicomonas gorgoniicola TaxID=1234144 RepID=A0ABT3MTT7_9GAMM|nr:hypothetical protein [Endozoicomonas gorgoniicola]MCW7552493.1 hypothetical protein [Endozoicomonas gorgoniicola]